MKRPDGIERLTSKWRTYVGSLEQEAQEMTRRYREAIGNIEPANDVYIEIDPRYYRPGEEQPPFAVNETAKVRFHIGGGRWVDARIEVTSIDEGGRPRPGEPTAWVRLVGDGLCYLSIHPEASNVARVR